MLKAYKYRIYPTDEQKTFIRQNVGANRWWYNYALAKIKKAWEENKEHLSAQYKVARELPTLKKEEETAWLREVDSTSLIWTSCYLDTAYKNFFRACGNRKNGLRDNGGAPSFKKKSYSGSYTTYQGIKVSWKKNEVTIPKLKTPIKAVLHRKFYGEIKQATLSYNNANKYYISILVKNDVELPPKKEVTYDTTLGIDLGVCNSIITSEGVKYDTVKVSKEDDKRYKMLSKRLSNKTKNSKNFEKARLKLAKFKNNLTNRKNYFIDKVTHDIVCDENINTICIEDLNVRGMLSNPRNAKEIQESSLNEIKTKLSYKSEFNGVQLVKVGRFFPSSKTCRHCGYVYKNLGDKRTWKCPQCGEILDRDINAAINIKNEGYRILTEAKQ